MNSTEHHGKYRLLWQHLTGSSENTLQMTFTDVKRVLGFPLPPCSRKHLSHRYGYQGSAVARPISDASWKSTRDKMVDRSRSRPRSGLWPGSFAAMAPFGIAREALDEVINVRTVGRV